MPRRHRARERDEDNHGAKREPAFALESALIKGGVLTAGGLYIGRAGLRLINRGIRYSAKLLAERTLRTTLPDFVVQRSFIAMTDMIPIVARDTFWGGAMLLTSTGIFYLSAPSYTLFEFAFGYEGKDGTIGDKDKGIYLIPHAYYLYRKASAWISDDMGLNLGTECIRHNLTRRFDSFVMDCLLHMLLNDLSRVVLMLEPTSAGPNHVFREACKKLLEAVIANKQAHERRQEAEAAGAANLPPLPKSSGEILCEWDGSLAAQTRVNVRDTLSNVWSMLHARDIPFAFFYRNNAGTQDKEEEDSILRTGCIFTPLESDMVSRIQVYLYVHTAPAPFMPGRVGDKHTKYFLDGRAVNVGGLCYRFG